MLMYKFLVSIEKKASWTQPSETLGKPYFYPRPADSIGWSVGRSVGRSVRPQILVFFGRNSISQLWDLIDTWGFREDLPLEPLNDPIVCTYIYIYIYIYIYTSNSYFLALGLNRDLGFSWGPSHGTPHDPIVYINIYTVSYTHLTLPTKA